MTGAWFLGATHSVPQDESTARSTIDAVRTDPQTAEMDAPPDWNEDVSDESGQLTGLARRAVGSYTEESKSNVDPQNLALASMTHNEIIDRQVASSGTAARREEAGEAGHGTMQIEIGIEPLNPGNAYGNDFFQAAPLSANEGSGDYMTPADQDNWLSNVAQANAVKRSKDAAMSSQYRSFFS